MGNVGYILNYINRPKPFGVSLKVIILLLIIVTSLIPEVTGNLELDSDIWTHLRTGLDNLNAGSVVTSDKYSYSSSKHNWINHSWLFELPLAYAYKYFEDLGLIIFHHSLLILTTVAFVLLAITIYDNILLASLSYLLILPFLSLATGLRPRGISILLTIVVLIITTLYRRGHKRIIYLLPFVMILWANCHAGFLLGLLIVFFELIVLNLSKSFLEKRHLKDVDIAAIIIAFLTATITLINPYGTNLFHFILTQTGSSQPHNTEWAGLSGIQLAYYFIFLIIPLVSLIFSKKIKSPTILFLFTIFGYFAQKNGRFIFLFSIFSLLLFLDTFSYLAAKRNWHIKKSFEVIMLMFIFVVQLLASKSYIQKNGWETFVTVNKSHYPIKAVTYLKENYSGGKISSQFAWGGYVLWNLGPQFQVAIDGRNITLYTPEYMEKSQKYYYEGNLKRLSELHKNPDFFLVETSSIINNKLGNNHEWKKIYQDNIASIYIYK